MRTTLVTVDVAPGARTVHLLDRGLTSWDDHGVRRGPLSDLAGALGRSLEVGVPGGPSPAASLDLSYELLLGTGAALRTGREAAYDELLGRHPDVDRTQVGLLHSAVVARLRAVVASGRRVGWVSWLGYPDGWRALVPYVRDGVAMVAIRPGDPTRLAAEVARLVRVVTA